eukprot:TRINITY_DN3818_c0_g1_i1.p2 TRINITY_DN3818_c0_g1~~TRINITY_DN3818_c0_g1_i1.p2  ORF type:complete len:247 (-),score=42.49 TRINITY_DN3818_c0_g1_i1:1447-2187(-)
MGNNASTASPSQLNSNPLIPKGSERFLLYCGYVLLLQDLSSSYLMRDIQTLKQITLVSKFLALQLKPLIEHNYFFNMHNDKQLKSNSFIWYKPKKAKNVLDQKAIPESVVELAFSDKKISPISTLPSNLTHLKLGWIYNRSLFDEVPPHTLTHIEFGYSYNAPLRNLPPNLLWLKFGHDFMQEIRDLPPKLEYLEFGPLWNHPISGLLPHSLKQLKLGVILTTLFQAYHSVSLTYHFHKTFILIIQ